MNTLKIRLFSQLSLIHDPQSPNRTVLLINKNAEGEFTYELFAPEQTKESMLKILGYK